MKKAVILIVSVLMTTLLMAQNNKINGLEEGTEVTLGPVSAAGYQHIDFPKKNIIIKRGAVANFNALSGEKLIIQHIKKDENGIEIATLTRKNGKNFFRFFPQVKANLSKALESGELKTLKYSGKNSIARH